MKAKGFGGALICDADGSSQDGNDRAPHGTTFLSPEWRELYKHTLREADRLGLEMSLNIQSGWNLGGPSVRPEESAKTLVFTDTSSGGTAVQWLWDFGDGTTSTDQNPVHAYREPGTYTVTVTDNVGCTKTTSVTVTEPPAIALTETHVNVLCNGNSTGSNLTEAPNTNNPTAPVFEGIQSMQYDYDNDGTVFNPCTEAQGPRRRGGHRARSPPPWAKRAAPAGPPTTARRARCG